MKKIKLMMRCVRMMRKKVSNLEQATVKEEQEGEMNEMDRK